jgi:hypothetical protein
MKKVFVAVAALSVLALVSCKKDYACSCTFEDSTSNYVKDFPKTKEDSAKNLCDMEGDLNQFMEGFQKCTLSEK